MIIITIFILFFIIINLIFLNFIFSRTFMLTTFGFAALTFAVGAFAQWAPTLILRMSKLLHLWQGTPAYRYTDCDRFYIIVHNFSIFSSAKH